MTSLCFRSPLLLLILLFGIPDSASAQRIDENVRTDTVEPFILEGVEVVTSDPYSRTSFLAPLNLLHATTEESIVLDEVFVEDGDTVTQLDLDEIERNLRALDIFSSISMELVQLELEEGEEMPVARLRIRARDSWSLRPNAGYREVDANPRVSLALREVNLAGYAQRLGVSIEYAPEESDKFRFGADALDHNVVGTHLRLGGAFLVSRDENAFALSLDRPFYSDRAPDAFALAGGYFNGPQNFYFHDVPHKRIAVLLERTEGAGWYSYKARGSRDLFRTSLRATYNRSAIDSAGPFQRAFDNSVGVFGGISSVRRRYVRFRDVDFEGDLQVPIGGMGNVTLGKISPHSGGLDNLFYIGAEARQSHLISNRLYLFGAVAAGTGLAGKQARYTIQRFSGGGLLLVDPGAIAVRVQQSTVWNWPRYLYVPVDKDNGLRGYDPLEIFGDNRLVANVEYRIVDIFQALGHRLGMTAFYDIGGVWNQGEAFTKARFHSSLGLGFRLGSARSNVNAGLYRLDIAWGLDPDSRTFVKKLIAGVSIGTSEFMTPFGSLDHVPPGVYTP